jgi:hypothetical protein
MALHSSPRGIIPAVEAIAVVTADRPASPLMRPRLGRAGIAPRAKTAWARLARPVVGAI